MFGFEVAKYILIQKIEREATENAACALELLRKDQEMTQQEICVLYLSVADELPGISGSHFMVPQILIEK